MTKKQKKNLTRIIASTVVFVLISLLNSILSIPKVLLLLMYLIPYSVCGYDVIMKAVRGVRNAQMLDENFLMSIATIGALIIGEYPEAVFVMLFYQTGELFQSISVGKSRKSIASLAKIRADEAYIEKDGALLTVSPEEVSVGDEIIVRPGDRVPLDGIITGGKTSLDTSALTGEALPKDVCEGDEIISGCINLSGNVKVRVTKPCSESTVSRILRMTEESSAKKAKYESIVTRFAKYYTPIVVILAFVIGVIYPLLYSLVTLNFDTSFFSTLFSRALIFLVVSCPCALVISVPLSFFAGIGRASKKGILIKGAGFIESLSECRTFVFDKTGTLTKGVFKVKSIHAYDVSDDVLLEICALAESYSAHPIAKSLLQCYGKECDLSRVTDVSETAGRGISAKIDGESVHIGNARFMKEFGISVPESHDTGTAVHAERCGAYLGYIIISDEEKPEAKDAIKDLKRIAGAKTVMLTGDNESSAKTVSENIGIDEYKSGLLPDGKVKALEEIIEGARGKVCFVGDGINDSPALSRADVGIAMGAFGSDAAIEYSDIVVMHDGISKIPEAVKISRSTVRTVKQNIAFAIGVKVLVLVLGAFGHANMWLASFADVGVTVLAILNAVRPRK